jgi:hypothetical protein
MELTRRVKQKRSAHLTGCMSVSDRLFSLHIHRVIPRGLSCIVQRQDCGYRHFSIREVRAEELDNLNSITSTYYYKQLPVLGQFPQISLTARG